MKKASYFFVMGVFIALSTGCSRFAVDDGSLDYQNAKLLKPIMLPEGQPSRDIYPLYPLPNKGVKNQVPLTNAKGNRYELPRPNVMISEPTEPAQQDQNTPRQTSSSSSVVEGQPVQTPAVQTGSADVVYPVALTQTEEGIPILQVEANAEGTRDKLRAVLGEANYMVVDDTLGRFSVKHVSFTGERLLQYRNLGSVTTVVVTKPDSQLAEGGESLRILSDLRKNW